jgi:streptogramin lyase
VRKIANGVITTIAGNGVRLNTGDNIPATQPSIADPEGVAADAAGNLYFATGAIRKVSPTGLISTLAPGTTDTEYGVYGNLAADAAGNVFTLQSKVINFTLDPTNASVVKVDATGRVTPFAGNGAAGFSGDGGPATQAMFSIPSGLAVDPSGTVYVSDTGNSRIRKVTPGGTISTFAMLDSPLALALNSAGNLYASSNRTLIQRIAPDGTVTSIGGGSYVGDGRLGTDTALSNIGAVAADAQGTVYFTERGPAVQYSAVDANFPSGGNRIRAILAKPTDFQVSASTLQFAGQSGGAPTPVQIITVSSAVTGLEFNVTIDIKGTGDWCRPRPVPAECRA